MDRIKFKEACVRVAGLQHKKKGIGTFSEKKLHLILKYYFEEYEQSHEIKIGSYIADIVGENGIIEIQTRDFSKIRKKLEALLPFVKVTVVYPIAFTKWLLWINTDTGEISKRRKTPKKGTPYQVFSELYKIKKLLNNENFNLCIVMVDIEEYRFLDGWGKDRKKGSSCCEKIPIDIHDEIYFRDASDYIKLLPDKIPEKFTTRDYQKASRVDLKTAQIALNILYNLKVIDRIGKQGRLFLYQVLKHNPLPY